MLKELDSFLLFSGRGRKLHHRQLHAGLQRGLPAGSRDGVDGIKIVSGYGIHGSLFHLAAVLLSFFRRMFFGQL